MADYIEFEGVLMSERGVFQVQSGKEVAGVLRPNIQRIRVAYASAANRPILEGIIGAALFLCGIKGVLMCFESLKGFRYYVFLLVFGILGAAMLWDVLKKRFVLFVTKCDGRREKLSFSVLAYPADIEAFLQKAKDQFGLEIQSDVESIKA